MVLETIGNTATIVRLRSPFVGRVVIARCEGHPFGKGGRCWLAKAPLSRSGRDLLARHLVEPDWLARRVERLERDLIRISLGDPRTHKLMTVAGISSVIATAVVASIGDIGRFASPEKLASYFGLTPKGRQSGKNRGIAYDLGGLSSASCG